jgi:uncharacterized alpha/beta hydrolase family protein
MAFLEKGLRSSGLETLSLSLPATFGSLKECVDSMYLQVNEIISDCASVNFVAHSMGGLVVREYLDRYNHPNIEKCVFIATPHKGSRLAEIVNGIPLYSHVFKPISALLPQNNHSKKNCSKIGLIIGDKSFGIFGNIFLEKNNDGRVEMSSALSDDADDIVILHFNHKEIHHTNETLLLVKKFLLDGTFH